MRASGINNEGHTCGEDQHQKTDQQRGQNAQHDRPAGHRHHAAVRR